MRTGVNETILCRSRSETRQYPSSAKQKFPGTDGIVTLITRDPLGRESRAKKRPIVHKLIFREALNNRSHRTGSPRNMGESILACRRAQGRCCQVARLKNATFRFVRIAFVLRVCYGGDRVSMEHVDLRAMRLAIPRRSVLSER